jgi:hypothetical protein
MKIAVDFDGTICKRNGIPTSEWNSYELPIEGALNAIKSFQSLGHEVWIFTSNPSLELVKDWLKVHKFPSLEVTNIKKPATIYIDDRAIRFTNWQDIRKYIL